MVFQILFWVVTLITITPITPSLESVVPKQVTDIIVESHKPDQKTLAKKTTPDTAVLGATTETVLASPTSTSTPTPTPTIIPTPRPTPIPTRIPTIPPVPTATGTPGPLLSPFVKPTNTPTNTTPFPKAKRLTGPEMDALFQKYADQYKIDREQLRRIAICESNLNPVAQNITYVGLYQFGQPSWVSNRKAMGLNTDISLRTDPEESIKTAAWMISQGKQAAWPNCK